jgi:hypothetical protein
MDEFACAFPKATVAGRRWAGIFLPDDPHRIPE